MRRSRSSIVGRWSFSRSTDTRCPFGRAYGTRLLACCSLTLQSQFPSVIAREHQKLSLGLEDFCGTSGDPGAATGSGSFKPAFTTSGWARPDTFESATLQLLRGVMTAAVGFVSSSVAGSGGLTAGAVTAARWVGFGGRVRCGLHTM